MPIASSMLLTGLSLLPKIPDMWKSVAGIFGKTIPSTIEEAGELVAAIGQKLIMASELIELGKVISGQESGRTSNDQITFFKSVGVAVQDAMSAIVALQNAQEMGLGQVVNW